MFVPNFMKIYKKVCPQRVAWQTSINRSTGSPMETSFFLPLHIPLQSSLMVLSVIFQALGGTS